MGTGWVGGGGGGVCFGGGMLERQPGGHLSFWLIIDVLFFLENRTGGTPALNNYQIIMQTYQQETHSGTTPGVIAIYPLNMSLVSVCACVCVCVCVRVRSCYCACFFLQCAYMGR